MPKRIQMTRARPWRDRHPDAVIVDRRTKWGNPWLWTEFYYLSKNTKRDALAEAVRRFEAAVIGFTSNGSWCRPQASPGSYIGEIIRLAPIELRGRDLACWCRLCDRHKDGLPLGEDCPDCEPCHADALLRAANEGGEAE